MLVTIEAPTRYLTLLVGGGDMQLASGHLGSEEVHESIFSQKAVTIRTPLHKGLKDGGIASTTKPTTSYLATV